MKRILFLIAAAFTLFCSVQFSVNAKGDDDYKVILTLKDGKVINGYIRTSLMDGAMKVGVSETPKGAYCEYETKDIISLVYPALTEDQEEILYVPCRAIKKVPNLISRRKEYKAPVLLRKIYEGEKLIGYVMPCVDATTNATTTYYRNTYKYLYRVKGEEVAQPYWFASDGIVVGLKSAMKFIFKDYPEIIEMFENGKIGRKEFLEHPEMIMPILNDVLVNRK